MAALADGAYCAAPDRLPGVRVTCLAALSGALRRLHARCVADASPSLDKSAATGDGNSGTSDVNDVDLLGRGDGVGSVTTTTSDSADQAGNYAAPAEAGSDTSDPAAATTETTGFPSPSCCREQRKRKRVLELAAGAFREKPREGLKLLQMEGVFSPGRPLDAREVAAFLRTAPGLDKATVGSYLGEAGVKRAPTRIGIGSLGTKATVLHGGEERKRSSFPGSASSTVKGTGGASEGGSAGQRKGGAEVYRGDTAEFHAEVLEAFVETFDFRGQGLLASLRMFLEAFRLPGEAQQIDRVLHVSCLFGGEGGGVFNA